MKTILFTEKNSPYGIEFLKRIYQHETVSTVVLVTRTGSMPFDYYKYDGQSYDITPLAKALNITHIQQDDLEDEDFISHIEGIEPELIIVGNFQKKLNSRLCCLAKNGAINFHPSPLPRYAGLAPFFWMAMNNERQGGVSCCRVTDIIDGGDILAQYDVELDGSENVLRIRELHFQKSYQLLNRILYGIASGQIEPVKQSVQARTYYSEPDDNLLSVNWNDSTQKILNIIRAASPFPGAKAKISGSAINITNADDFCRFDDSANPGVIRYHQDYPVIATSDGWVRVLSIAPIRNITSL